MKKQFKITQNGLIFLYIDGGKTGSYFYVKGSEKELIRDGFEEVNDITNLHHILDTREEPK